MNERSKDSSSKNDEHIRLSERALVINEEKSVQKLEVSKNFGKIGLPARIMICGPTLSGKSQLILKLFKFQSDIFRSKFREVVYCIPSGTIPQHYNYISALKDACPILQISEGIPNLKEYNLIDKNVESCLILDDLIEPVLESEAMLEVATKHSHHGNLTLSMFN